MEGDGKQNRAEEGGIGSGEASFLLVERARSECARSTRAVKDSLVTPPNQEKCDDNAIGKQEALALGDG
jgi:hypothetical protein